MGEVEAKAAEVVAKVEVSWEGEGTVERVALGVTLVVVRAAGVEAVRVVAALVAARAAAERAAAERVAA